MYAFEVCPAFRGTTYSDELQMIDADTGDALPFVAGVDALTLRLFGIGPRHVGWRGWDYGFADSAGPVVDRCSALTLALGAGLAITASGSVSWGIPIFPLWMRDPEYRMTLDLVRYGVTVRVMDTILQVEN